MTEKQKDKLKKDFWHQANLYMYPELFPSGSFDRSKYFYLYDQMYDEGLFSEEDLWLLEYEDFPIE